MVVYLALSALMTVLAIAMLGASVAMRGRVPIEGIQPGDDYLYAVAGGIVAVVAWVLAVAAVAAASTPPA